MRGGVVCCDCACRCFVFLCMFGSACLVRLVLSLMRLVRVSSVVSCLRLFRFGLPAGVVLVCFVLVGDLRCFWWVICVLVSFVCLLYCLRVLLLALRVLCLMLWWVVVWFVFGCFGCFPVGLLCM